MDETTFPEDLTVLSDEDLANLLTDVRGEFERLRDEGSRDLPLLTRLVDQVEAVEGEQANREQAAAEADQLIAELDRRLNPDATDAEGDEDGDEDEDGTDAEDTTEDDSEDAADPALVTASAAKKGKAPLPALSAVSRRSKRPAAPARNPVTITASADVPGLATGQRIDPQRVGVAFHDRARALADRSPRVSVARIEKPIPASHRFNDDPAHNQQVLDDVVNSRVHDAAALVASGGWCAPSVPLFELFEVGDTDGLFDLPTIGSSRGGVLLPSFFTADDADGALWVWTEEDDVSAADGSPTKPCLKIPCPTWTDYRNVAYGLCVTHGNLSDRAFPELTRSFVNLVMRAHAHRMSQVKIASVAATATAVTAAGLDSDAAGDLINTLQVQATALRSAYGYSRTRVVEVVLPDWTIPMLRGNVAKRAGVDLLGVTDAMVTDWLTSGGIRPQFVTDYQPLSATATDWPTSLKFLVYLSGSYVWSDGGEIDLGVVRDSTLNATNDFTAAWSEEFGILAQPGPDAREVTLTIDTDGVTACCPAV